MALVASVLLLPCMFAAVGSLRRSVAVEEYTNPGDILDHTNTQTKFDDYSRALPFLRALYDYANLNAQVHTWKLDEEAEKADQALTFAISNQTLEAHLLNKKQQACGIKDDASPFSFERPTPVAEFSCDLSTSDDLCEALFTQFDEATTAMLQDFTSKVGEHNDNYQVEAGNCTDKTIEYDSQVVQRQMAEGRFREAVAATSLKDTINLGGHCASGWTVGFLCSKFGGWESLKAQAEGTGNLESQQQRESEWNVLRLSSCLSQNFPTETGHEALTKCLAEVDYANQVGDLNYYESTARQSVLLLTCDNIKRDYTSWTVPSNLATINEELRGQIAQTKVTDTLEDGSFERCPSPDTNFVDFVERNLIEEESFTQVTIELQVMFSKYVEELAADGISQMTKEMQVAVTAALIGADRMTLELAACLEGGSLTAECVAALTDAANAAESAGELTPGVADGLKKALEAGLESEIAAAGAAAAEAEMQPVEE